MLLLSVTNRSHDPLYPLNRAVHRYDLGYLGLVL